MFLSGGRSREQPSRGLLVPESSTIPGHSQFIQLVISDSVVESLGRGGWAEASTLPYLSVVRALLSGSLRVITISLGPELRLLTSLFGFFESSPRSLPWPGGNTVSKCLLHGPWARKIFPGSFLFETHNSCH